MTSPTSPSGAIAGSVLPIRRAEELIATLPGVLSVRIVPNDSGSIDEIHVLTTNLVLPKQTVRNIESALIAQLGWRVNHRKISIATTLDPMRASDTPAQATPAGQGVTPPGGVPTLGSMPRAAGQGALYGQQGGVAGQAAVQTPPSVQASAQPQVAGQFTPNQGMHAMGPTPGAASSGQGASASPAGSGGAGAPAMGGEQGGAGTATAQGGGRPSGSGSFFGATFGAGQSSGSREGARRSTPSFGSDASGARRTLLFEDVEVRRSRTRGVMCRVTLSKDQIEFFGEAEGPDTERSRVELASRAAVHAIVEASRVVSGGERGLALEGAKTIDAFDRSYIFVSLAARIGRDTMVLTGSCEVRDSAETSAVLAVLDATNRWMHLDR